MRLLALGLLLAFLYLGCGQEGNLSTATDTGGGGGGSDVGLTGSVATPRTASKSVSLAPKGADGSGAEAEGGGAFSLSKSAGSSSSSSSSSQIDNSNQIDSSKSEQVIVSKATVEKTDGGGKVTIQKLDGTVMDTCLVQSGVLVGCNINASDLGSNKLVEIVAVVDGKKVSKVVDLSGATNGQTVSTGTTNSETSVANVLLHTNCDSNANPENKTGNFKSCVSDGSIKSETYKAIEKQLGLTSTAGADDVQGSMAAIKKAIAAGLAEGKITGFAEMAKAVTGDSGILATLKSLDSDLASVNLVTAAANAFKGAGGIFSMLKDSTTAAKWKGDDALLALAKTFGKQDSTEAEACITSPANCRGLYNKYADDFAAGAASAFDKMIQGGKAFGEYMEKFGATAMTAAQADAAKALFGQMDFAAKAGSLHDELGASCYTQILAAGSDSTKINNIINNPNQYASTIFKDPNALVVGGTAVAQQWINQMGTGGTLTGFTPCTSDTQCPSGQTCSTTTRWCSASAAGTGNGSGSAGAGCSQNSDCTSNSCVGSVCTFGSGDIIGKKLYGQTCTVTSDCINGMTCSSGTCGFSGGGGGGGGGDSGLANGATCTANGDCTSTYCGGPSGTRVCTALAAGVLNDVCSASGQCSDIHTCSSNVCLRNNSQACSANGNCVSGYCGGPSNNRSCKAVGQGALADVCTANNQCSSNNCSTTCRNVYNYPTAAGDSNCEGVTSVTLTQTSATAGEVQHNADASNTATINGSNISYAVSGFTYEGTFSASDFNVAVSGGCRIHFTNP